MRLGKDAMYRQQDLAFADALELLHHNLTLAFSTEDIQEGVKRVLREARPALDRADEDAAVGVVGMLCRTSDRPRRAAGTEALTVVPLAASPRCLGVDAAHDRHARAGRRRRGWEDDLRDSRGCILEAGGQVDDALAAGVPGPAPLGLLDLPDDAARRRAPPPGAPVPVARRARRLQHARRRRRRGFLGGMCLAGACGVWDTGLDGPARPGPRRHVRGARPRRRRARPAGVPGVMRIERPGRLPTRSPGRRSSCTSTSTCSIRRCCPPRSRRRAG